MSSKMEFVVVEKAKQRLMPETPPEFSGTLDSDAHTPNGGVMTLHVSSCPDIAKGEKAAVTVDILELDREFIRNNEVVSEGSDDDLLATFEGFLENRNGRFIFSEMKPVAEPDWKSCALFPYFHISFAAENYSIQNSAKDTAKTASFPVVVGLVKEENEGTEFEIGFVIKKGGAVIGSSGKTASLFDGEYTTHLPLSCFNIRTNVESVGLACATYNLGRFDRSDFLTDEEHRVNEASSTRVYSSTATAQSEKNLKVIESMLKRIDHLVTTSNNPYFQNIEAVKEYYKTLELYRSQMSSFHQLKSDKNANSNDIDTMARGILQPLAQTLNALEEKITGYLKSGKHPPAAYMNKIKHYSVVNERNKEIDSFLNNPIVLVLGLLPGAGVVTGSLKLMQGKTFDGLMDLFGNILEYGSFIKLARVARAYNRTSKSTVELLYSYRYRNIVSQITTNDVMKKITGVSLNKSNAVLGNLFSTVGSFKSLIGNVNSVSELHKNRKIILDMTERAVAGITNGYIRDANEYVRFVKKLGNTNETMEYFAILRLAYGSVKAGKDAHSAVQSTFKEMTQLLGVADFPGAKDFNPAVITNSTTMFEAMNNNKIEIDKVLASATINFPTDSAIVEHFNATSGKRDAFNVALNPDMRTQNTRDEMLLALEDIITTWKKEQAARDAWIKENWSRYNLSLERDMQQKWAKETKVFTSELEYSLETQIKNFITKISGQVEFAEGLTRITLHAITGTVNDGMVYKTNILFNLDSAIFRNEATELINTYY